MQANLADLFEHAVDAFGDREYLIAEGKRRTYREIEERSNRLAHHLAAKGVGPGDHVGIYAYNSVEWVEALWAVFKLRAVWININFRYVAEELRYVFENADLVGLIHAREFSDRVGQVADVLGDLRVSVVIEDGSGLPFPRADSEDYETVLAASSPERDFAPRSADDIYILYTGGTTGMPKGVVWRHEDVFYALGGGIDILAGTRVADPGDITEAARSKQATTSLPIAPLMHGASQWAVMGRSFAGDRIVLVAKFDAEQVWKLIHDEKINVLTITGDAMGRPLVEAYEAAGSIYDHSSLVAVTSTAAVFSPSVKDDFLRLFPDLVVTDAIGSSETGGQGVTFVRAGHTAMKGGPTVSAISDTVVLDEDGREVAPGSGVVGKVARKGNIPIGYYRDPAKTEATFVTYNGVRYAIPGDFAMVEADRTITLLGRGSVSINSGGEKIFPEEVESALKSHPAVWDATVVGVPDERWGSRVAAVVQLREGHTADLELHLVDSTVRSPSGKPDYQWAKRVATGGTTSGGDHSTSGKKQGSEK
jgi:acyl-CoA synthetase (AMP-forming)/AMP-acid ligase II